MSDPVSRTILLLDIEKYSDRDDVEQAYLRRMLYGVTDRVLESAAIDRTLRRRADRGDSVMELIDAGASMTALLRALLTEVPVELRAVNRTASASAQIRLRAVLATGYVAVDELDGWVGSDLNHACRLLDGELLRAALRERRDDFALCVSEPVHSGIVRHDYPGIPRDEFHAITVDSKNGPLRAWLHGALPGGAAPDAREVPREAPREVPREGTAADVPEGPAADVPDDTDRAARDPRPTSPPPASVNFLGGSPSFGGSFVNGDQHGVSGGVVHGDVHLGGGGAGRGERG
ncbi:hypothetical protein AB0N81_27100 [Streptomyces sp. NPDC093510]|uniref:hypothetical protein n=1 Tax=Streptomyces sp. NPDC093510 TaxID=3155199 RepID=UPI00341F3047